MKLRHFFYGTIASLLVLLLVWILQPLEWDNKTSCTECLVRHWGYPFEAHTVETKDGYLLELHRIPHGRVSTDKGKPRIPVLLQHGLALDSSNFVANLPHQSLAFMLADAGFDVWLGNCRGNSYGRRHVKFHHWDSEFWDFSWQEMASHDMPAIVDRVLEVTGYKKLDYIGHSQGGLIAFARLSEDDDFTDKINNVFALAPALSVTSIRGPIYMIAPLAPVLQFIERIAGGSFGLFRRSIINDLLSSTFCKDSIYFTDACVEFVRVVGGDRTDQLNTSRLDVYMSSYPDGMSTKNVVHFGQMVSDKRTARFDYGIEENLKRYGCEIPPAYNFTNVRVPMHIWYSPNDALVSDVDLREIIIPTLHPEYLKLNVSLPQYNHIDFHWGLRAVEDIYEPIIDILMKEHNIIV